MRQSRSARRRRQPPRAQQVAKLASVLVLGGASLFSCHDDEATSSPNRDVHDDARASQRPEGGAAGANRQGEAGGSRDDASKPRSLGGEGGAPSSNFSEQPNEAGAPATTGGERLAVCGRLTGVVAHAVFVTRTFAKAVYADCRVKWVVPLRDPLVDYMNTLLAWNLDFWGCRSDPVKIFALTYEAPPLSQGDASILLEHYLSIVDDELALSVPEHLEMQAALRRLAAPSVSSDSNEPSRSSCRGLGGSGAGDAGAGAGDVPSIAGAGGAAVLDEPGVAGRGSSP